MNNYSFQRVGKRTIQELRKFGGKAAEVRKRYNLFRSKQPTARLRMGKVVQEWNPTPTPVYLDTTTPANTSNSCHTTSNNAGFNDLLSQVTSASGMDIEKPVEKPKSAVNKEPIKQTNTYSKSAVQPHEHKEELNFSNGYVNLAFEADPNLTLSTVTNEQEIQIKQCQQEVHQSNPITLANRNKMENLQTNFSKQQIIQVNNTQQNASSSSINQTTVQLNPVSSEISHSYHSTSEMLNKNASQVNSLNDHNMKTEPTRSEDPFDISKKQSDINKHTEPFQQTKEKGISVSIQTRIMNTRITKSKIRRRKDSVFPLRNDYSDSTSEKESKKGFLLYKKQSNGAALSFKASNKYKRRRKRNQIAFQEKISEDNVQYNIPITSENPFSKS